MTAISLNITLVKSQVLQLQANLDLRNPIFSLLDRELFDLRKICVLKLAELARPVTLYLKGYTRFDFFDGITFHHDFSCQQW